LLTPGPTPLPAKGGRGAIWGGQATVVNGGTRTGQCGARSAAGAGLGRKQGDSGPFVVQPPSPFAQPQQQLPLRAQLAAETGAWSGLQSSSSRTRASLTPGSPTTPCKTQFSSPDALSQHPHPKGSGSGSSAATLNCILQAKLPKLKQENRGKRSFSSTRGDQGNVFWKILMK